MKLIFIDEESCYLPSNPWQEIMKSSNQKRGYVNIKGKGEMFVYLLKGCKEIQPNPVPAREHFLLNESVL